MITLIALVTALAIVPVAIYFHYRSKFNYWKKRGINGPEPDFPNGNAFNDVHSTTKLMTWKLNYGKIYGIHVGFQPVLVIEDPECLRDILITNFDHFTDRRIMSGHPFQRNDLVNQNGDKWKHDRAIISPTFSSGKMKFMFTLIEEAFDCLDKELSKYLDKKVQIEPQRVFSMYFAMVIAKCAFASDFDVFSNPENELYQQIQSIFKKNRKRFIANTLLPSFMRELISFSPVNPDALNYIGAVCKEIIGQRKQNLDPNWRVDLLQLLIDANKEDGEEFSELKVISNSILFFIAGSETTSTLLTWTSYNLAMNPDVQDKLFAELSQAQKENGQLDYETLFTLKYLDSVINETLRLFPLVPSYERVVTADHKLPNSVLVKKGVVIRIPVYTLHRDEEHFEEPEKFDPERFMPENKAHLKPFTFLPFVDGPRNCIGKRFALLAAKLTLAKLCLKYKFVKCQNTPETINFVKNSFILEVDNFRLRLEGREGMN